MLNIILGILFIIGGLSGKLVFIGTNSGVLLAVVGFILVIWGAYRMYQQRQTPLISTQSTTGPRICLCGEYRRSKLAVLFPRPSADITGKSEPAY
jgi:hypothetical protein